MTALRAVPGTPIEEVTAALRALTNGLLGPDLTVPLKTILGHARDRAAGHASYVSHPERQALVIGPGVLELARAINGREIRKVTQRHLAPPDPVDVANAAQEAL